MAAVFVLGSVATQARMVASTPPPATKGREPVSKEFKARYGHIAVDNPVTMAAHERFPVDRVYQSTERALMVLRHVAGDGGVIAQLLSRLKSSVDRVDPVLLGEVTARMEELTELARRVRAEEICAAWDQMAPAEPDGR